MGRCVHTTTSTGTRTSTTTSAAHSMRTVTITSCLMNSKRDRAICWLLPKGVLDRPVAESYIQGQFDMRAERLHSMIAYLNAMRSYYYSVHLEALLFRIDMLRILPCSRYAVILRGFWTVVKSAYRYQQLRCRFRHRHHRFPQCFSPHLDYS